VKLGKSVFRSEREFRNWFAPLLRDVRKSRFLTQFELSEIVGVRQTDISFWENGKTSISVFHYFVIEGLFGIENFPRSWNIRSTE
jgi:DNA-binding XRE family transcriptional regulator